MKTNKCAQGCTLDETWSEHLARLKQTHTLEIMRDQDNGRYLVMRGPVLIADCGKGNFGKTESERIVRAVNSHEELLEALKDALNQLDTLRLERQEYDRWANERINMVSSALLIGKKAIAKAESTPSEGTRP